LVDDPHLLQPELKFRRTPQPEHLAQVERVVERHALVVEHDAVGAGNAHDKVHARNPQQREQRIHVVLVNFGLAGVAYVASHRQASNLPQK